MIVERGFYKSRILEDVKKKMVLIAGPRQVGKTFLATEVMKMFKKSVYLNYDFFEHREIIKKLAWPENAQCIVFDELHKMPDWKNFLKGVYDIKKDNLKIIVTGSARLDFFRKSGDSLAGRYFLHHLFPFTVSELAKDNVDVTLDDLMFKSGFPEPFLSNKERDVLRWRNQYVDVILRDEVLDIEKVDKLSRLKLIFELLRRRVGSPVSIKSIAEDVQLSPNTVKRYIYILENLYVIFRVTPYSKNIARSILKEPKIYFFDNGLVVGDDGAKFENFVALSLFKHVMAMRDYEGRELSLHYLKTKDGKEVDFCLTENDEPVHFIEAKYSERKASSGILYFFKKYKVKSTQIVKSLHTEYVDRGVEILKAKEFLKNLYL